MSEEEKYNVTSTDDADIDRQRVVRFVEEFKATMDVEKFTESEKEFAMVLLGSEIGEMNSTTPFPCPKHGIEFVNVEIKHLTTYEQQIEHLEEDGVHETLERMKDMPGGEKLIERYRQVNEGYE